MFEKCFKVWQVSRIIENVCLQRDKRQSMGKCRKIQELGRNPYRGLILVPGACPGKGDANSVISCNLIVFMPEAMAQAWEIALQATAYCARGFRTNVAKHGKYMILLTYPIWKMFPKTCPLWPPPAALHGRRWPKRLFLITPNAFLWRLPP